MMYELRSYDVCTVSCCKKYYECTLVGVCIKYARVVIEIVMIDKHPGSGGLSACCNLQPRSKLTINRKSTILYSPPSKSLRSTFSLLIQILDGDLQICYAWE